MAAKGPETLAPIPDGVADAGVLLRAWRDDDLELLRAGSEDDYVAMIEHLPVPFSEPEARAWLTDQHTWPGRGRGWSLAIADRATGAGIGSIGLVLRHPPGVAELGYWIAPGRRGAGAATTAVRLLSRWAITGDLGVHRLHALIEPWNLASQRVVENTGFVREGLLRAYSTYRGEHRDDLLYSLLRSDIE
jgi:[ribosomal protein S5]-alanine N-acetyltransferase